MRLFRSPLALAALVTLANAAKPVTVDDTAYLLYARHICAHPSDPYGFTVFWWDKPEPAMNVLCPPVVPYWLAAGESLFGESVVLLKLWLFPFVYLLARALRALLIRFARGSEGFALPLLMLSPAVLPTVNLMLDIPAVALGLLAVELFARACALTSPLEGEVGEAWRAGWGGRDTKSRTSDTAESARLELPNTSLTPHPPEQRLFRRPPPQGGRLRACALAVLAGLVAALAMQAKYSAFVVPVVIAWYGLTHRRFLLAAVACLGCAAAFAGWELWVANIYGVSHFAHHAAASGSAPPPAGQSKLQALVEDKLTLLPSLASYLGCLAVGAGLLAASALRIPRRYLAAVAAVWCAGFVLIAVLPKRWLAVGGEVTAGTLFWHASGFVWLAAVFACCAVLLFRKRKGLSLRPNAASLFLVGWFVLECGAALALTPFPAARRVVGITLVMGLLAARISGRISRTNPDRRAPRWVPAVGVAAGIAVAAIDTLDAFPEKVCAERAAAVVRDRPPDSTVWFVGHWGFQYYCERAGMRPFVPGGTRVRPGDYVVLPVYPDAGFHRPHAGFEFAEPPNADVVAEIVWTDWLSAQTVPNFYGGMDPVAARDHPRLRVRVYQLR